MAELNFEDNTEDDFIPLPFEKNKLCMNPNKFRTHEFHDGSYVSVHGKLLLPQYCGSCQSSSSLQLSELSEHTLSLPLII